MSRYQGRCVIPLECLQTILYSKRLRASTKTFSPSFYLYSSPFITERYDEQYSDTSCQNWTPPDEIVQLYSRPVYTHITQNSLVDDSFVFFLTYSGNRWFTWGLPGKVSEELVIDPDFWVCSCQLRTCWKVWQLFECRLHLVHLLLSFVSPRSHYFLGVPPKSDSPVDKWLFVLISHFCKTHEKG